MKTLPFILACFVIISFESKSFVNAQQSPVLAFSPAPTPVTISDSILLAKDCLKRREMLSQKLGDGILLINNNDRTKDNFLYLTGWTSNPSSMAMDISSKLSFELFVPGSSPNSIIWNGIQPGNKEAEKMGATAFDFFDFKKHLKAYFKTGKRLFLLKQDNVLRDQLKGLLLTKADSDKIVFIDTTLNELRVIKSDYELSCIKKAINITQNALLNSFKTIQPGKFEFEIAALYDYEYTRNCTQEAFPSIVGSGKNATTLHYESNNCIIKKGELVLMDVGATFNGYAADITRTVPSDGKFTEKQLALYNLVLKAQTEGLKMMKPGNRILDFHRTCVDVLTHGLYKLGFITDTTKDWQKEVFILYQSGHYLGLDVHDVGRYSIGSSEYVRVKMDSRGRDLLPGMIITIEPGIYINPDMLRYIYDIFGDRVPRGELDAYVSSVKPAFEKYANMGIRIEDDVLITKTGNELLSGTIPRQPDEIEKMMQNK